MNTNSAFPKKTYQVLLFLLLCRVLAMCFVPLNDSTEARYGEIARIMQETGNWITLMHNYGAPFWAKPPLSTWLSAFSITLFGDNQFAVRVPALLLSIGMLSLVWFSVRKHSGAIIASTACLILGGCFYFLLDAGAVMTDPALLFCITLMLVSFWKAVVEHSRAWGYCLFIAAGLGLLAKGPIALVLAGIPVFIWVLYHKQWSALWKRLPWFGGLLVMSAIALPWYYLAEAKTPGFLNYFIVGEHFNRFLKPGWQGDLYGFAHVAPYGMIWVYFIIGTLPWGIVGLFWCYKYRQSTTGKISRLYDDGWMSYWLLAMTVPLLFFTFAGNIIYPYAFPALIPFAIVFAEFLSYLNVSKRDRDRLHYLALLSGFIFIFATGLFYWAPQWVAKSQDRVIALWQEQDPNPDSYLVYWSRSPLYSAQFYSKGRVKATDNFQILYQWLSQGNNHYLVVNPVTANSLPPDFQTHLTPVGSVPVLKESYVLYRVDRLNSNGENHS